MYDFLRIPPTLILARYQPTLTYKVLGRPSKSSIDPDSESSQRLPPPLCSAVSRPPQQPTDKDDFNDNTTRGSHSELTGQ